jgi:hypothetical protein
MLQSLTAGIDGGGMKDAIKTKWTVQEQTIGPFYW